MGRFAFFFVAGLLPNRRFLPHGGVVRFSILLMFNSPIGHGNTRLCCEPKRNFPQSRINFFILVRKLGDGEIPRPGREQTPWDSTQC